MEIRLYIKKNGIQTTLIVEPILDAFGRYKTRDYINTVQGRIERKYVTKIENIDEPWLNESYGKEAPDLPG